MPFPLRGIDTDNGGEFINEILLRFSQKHGIEFTRSRPYRKNDQAWVEQKNGLSFGAWSATDDWRASLPPSPWRGSTAVRGSS